MPAKSSKQQRLMGGCSHNPGKMKNCPEGMSKEKMREMAKKPGEGYKKPALKKPSVKNKPSIKKKK